MGGKVFEIFRLLVPLLHLHALQKYRRRLLLSVYEYPTEAQSHMGSGRGQMHAVLHRPVPSSGEAPQRRSRRCLCQGSAAARPWTNALPCQSAENGLAMNGPKP